MVWRGTLLIYDLIGSCVMKQSKYRSIMRLMFEEYIASKEWKKCREKVKKNASGICAKCGEFIGDSGIAHHQDYEHWGKGNFQEVRSCLYLCKKCHNKMPHDNVPFFAKQNFDHTYPEWQELQDAINRLDEDAGPHETK